MTRKQVRSISVSWSATAWNRKGTLSAVSHAAFVVLAILAVQSLVQMRAKFQPSQMSRNPAFRIGSIHISRGKRLNKPTILHIKSRIRRGSFQQTRLDVVIMMETLRYMSPHHHITHEKVAYYTALITPNLHLLAVCRATLVRSKNHNCLISSETPKPYHLAYVAR